MAQRRKSGISLREIGEEWAAMDDAARDEFRPAVAAFAPRACRVGKLPKPGMVWPGCSDGFYPLSTDAIGDANRRVKDLNGKWAEQIGQSSVLPARGLDWPEVKHLCEETLGRGRCERVVDNAEQLALQNILGRLERWSEIHRLHSTRYEDAWPLLGLLYFGPAEVAAAGSGDIPTRGVALLLLNSDHRPFAHVVLAAKCLPIIAGSVVTFELNFDNLWRHIGSARIECSATTTS